jgi:hypothetical protein
MVRVAPEGWRELRDLAAHLTLDRGAAVAADPASKPLEAAADSACTALADCCYAIAQLPAQTVEHVRLEARWHARLPRQARAGGQAWSLAAA